MNAAEQDLRGEVALAIMAMLTWSEAHGGTKMLLDGSVSKWLTTGRPDVPGIARALKKLRYQLAQFIARGGHVPAWFPASLLKALGEPCCARDLTPSSATQPDALPACSPSQNAPTNAAHSGQTAPNPSQNFG